MILNLIYTAKAPTGQPSNVYGAPSTSNASTALPMPVQQQAATSQESAPNTAYGFWQLEYYKKFFNVDTPDVLNRMRVATIPVTSFKSQIENNPDLYGPLWISTTVVLLIFVSSCMAESIRAYMEGTEYNYDFRTMSYAFAVFYPYVTFVPLGLFLMGKYFHAPVSYLDMVNIYGYGCSIWMIVSLVCIAPSELVRWVSVGVGGGISAYHLARNMTMHKMIWLTSLVLHAGFVICMKIVFYP